MDGSGSFQSLHCRRVTPVARSWRGAPGHQLMHVGYVRVPPLVRSDAGVSRKGRLLLASFRVPCLPISALTLRMDAQCGGGREGQVTRNLNSTAGSSKIHISINTGGIPRAFGGFRRPRLTALLQLRLEVCVRYVVRTSLAKARLSGPSTPAARDHPKRAWKKRKIACSRPSAV